jgi:hypothetical protein
LYARIMKWLFNLISWSREINTGKYEMIHCVVNQCVICRWVYLQYIKLWNDTESVQWSNKK